MLGLYCCFDLYLWKKFKTIGIMRTATIKDFKKNNVLYMKKGGYSFSITKKYSEGIWETREGKVIFESEAKFYDVNETK